MYEKDGALYRDLFKAYGIRFIIKVTGRAGKFDVVPLLLNIGSGVGLLAVVSSLVVFISFELFIFLFVASVAILRRAPEVLIV
jgi:hypothetical protein